MEQSNSLETLKQLNINAKDLVKRMDLFLIKLEQSKNEANRSTNTSQ
jgi:hypothetical protein